jgi:hypothetical protein
MFVHAAETTCKNRTACLPPSTPRTPTHYIANLFTAGDSAVVRTVLRKLAAVGAESVRRALGLDLDEDLLPMTGNRGGRTWPDLPDAGAPSAREDRVSCADHLAAAARSPGGSTFAPVPTRGLVNPWATRRQPLGRRPSKQDGASLNLDLGFTWLDEGRQRETRSNSRSDRAWGTDARGHRARVVEPRAARRRERASCGSREARLDSGGDWSTSWGAICEALRARRERPAPRRLVAGSTVCSGLGDALSAGAGSKRTGT